MNYALLAAPLSQRYKKQLNQIYGDNLQYVILAELRKFPLPKLLWKLFLLRGSKMVLPVEESSTRAILPVIILLASISRVWQLELCDEELKAKKISRFYAIVLMFRLIWATMHAWYSMFRARRELKQLKQKSVQNSKATFSATDKVLFLNANLWFGVKAGGSVGHIAGVANGFAGEEMKVTYAAVCQNQMLRNVEFYGLRSPEVFGLPPELNYYRHSHGVYSQMKSWLKDNPVDFIYQRLSVCNYSGAVLSLEKNIPLILEYNGSEAWIAKNWGRSLKFHDLAVAAEEASLQQANYIVTISEILAEELEERGIPREKIIVYPNCIDPKVFSPDRFSTSDFESIYQEHNVKPDSCLVTFVGTFGIWHGVEVFAQAICNLVRESKSLLEEEGVIFFLVGDGEKMPQVKEILAQEPEAESFIRLTGLVPQQEAPKYLAASNILVSPHVPNEDGSRFFGSPTKLFEYMAMGKAVIASDLEQIGQVLQNSYSASDLPKEIDEKTNKIGILTQPGSAEELQSSLKYLIHHKQLQKFLGENARKEALNKYTWKNHVAAILKPLVTDN